MKIARVLYPVNVLGPGNRIAFWLSGCPHKCDGCINPDLWEQQDEQELSIITILSAVNAIAQRGPIDGFVFTGGDPLYQAEELSKLLPMLKAYSKDILVYTGYDYEELISANNSAYNECLNNISVLIDGPYIDELNEGTPLRGSSNQRIIFLDKDIEPKYTDYLSNMRGNEVQQFPISNGYVSVGIHHKGFQKELKTRTEEMGVIVHG